MPENFVVMQSQNGDDRDVFLWQFFSQILFYVKSSMFLYQPNVFIIYNVTMCKQNASSCVVKL